MARRVHVIAALLAGLAAGTNASAQAGDRRPLLEVVIDNRAPASGAELATARLRADYIFEQAGIRIAWALYGAARAIVPRFDEPIRLVLIDQSVDRQIANNPRTLGFALPSANRVYVLYERVHALARDRHVQPGWFLGAVIAHEVTHVLLPGVAHAERGLMAASIQPDPASPHEFTREEARLLRERLDDTRLAATR